MRSSPFYPPVVNLRDGFTLGPEVPLQIRYDAASKASCRMFFKFETLLDQSALFADVADAAFNGKAAQLCAT